MTLVSSSFVIIAENKLNERAQIANFLGKTFDQPKNILFYFIRLACVEAFPTLLIMQAPKTFREIFILIHKSTLSRR